VGLDDVYKGGGLNHGRAQDRVGGSGTEELETLSKQRDGEGAIGGNKILTQPRLSSSRFN